MSVYGSNLLLLASILLAIVLGWMLGVHPKYSLFVAGCLYFSSNPLATRMIDGEDVNYVIIDVSGRLQTSPPLSGTVEAGNRGNRISVDLSKIGEGLSSRHVAHGSESSESDIGTSLGGILVMQDIQLGTLMALLPFFMESKSPHGSASSHLMSGGCVGCSNYCRSCLDSLSSCL